MGFWSKNCMAEGCGHPLLSLAATNDANRWMSEGVAIKKNGSLHVGEYDGYGRLDDAEDALADDEVTVYHVACWELLGSPITYVGRASHAEDQGWFFDEGDHDKVDPRSGARRVGGTPMTRNVDPDASTGSPDTASSGHGEMLDLATRAVPESVKVAERVRLTGRHVGYALRVTVITYDRGGVATAQTDVTHQLDGLDAVAWLAEIGRWASEGQHVRIDMLPPGR